MPHASAGCLDNRQLRCPGLGHPNRQQRTPAVRLIDDKMSAAAILQHAHHNDALAGSRMVRVEDQNVKGVFLGSISCSRKGR